MDHLVPKVIRERVADDDILAKNLFDRSHSNWAPVIDRLYVSEKRFMDIDSREFSVWLNGTVKYLPFHSILHLDEMLLEQINGDVVKFNTHMYECIFNNLGNLKPTNFNQDGTNDKVILKMKELLERYDKALKITEERINKKKDSLPKYQR